MRKLILSVALFIVITVPSLAQDAPDTEWYGLVPNPVLEILENMADMFANASCVQVECSEHQMLGEFDEIFEHYWKSFETGNQVDIEGVAYGVTYLEFDHAGGDVPAPLYVRQIVFQKVGGDNQYAVLWDLEGNTRFQQNTSTVYNRGEYTHVRSYSGPVPEYALVQTSGWDDSGDLLIIQNHVDTGGWAALVISDLVTEFAQEIGLGSKRYIVLGRGANIRFPDYASGEFEVKFVESWRMEEGYVVIDNQDFVRPEDVYIFDMEKNAWVELQPLTHQ